MHTTTQLPETPRLSDFQAYIADVVVQRGFQDETVPEIMMLFLEECGELAKAFRKESGIHYDKASSQHGVAEELADVFMYLLDLANHAGVDLETAFRDKDAKNQKRVWTQNS